LLLERFDSTGIWGWKDPRNSLTLPFWQNLLPDMKTLVMVRNPMEVAHSMKERNGTSYSFGLRLWEIYNRRLIEGAGESNRLFTHYDLFFEDPEKELQRIASFGGLPDTKIPAAAKLVATRRRHTHFSIDQLIDAGVSEEVIDLYRALIAEASNGRKAKASKPEQGKSDNAELLSGSVSRVTTFVPERIAQIEHLYGELLEQTEARHKAEIEKLSHHLAHIEEQHKAQIEELVTHLTKTEAAHKAQFEELVTHLAKTEATHKSQVEELTTLHNNEIEQLRQRIVEMNDLLHQRSVNLAEDERHITELTDRLRKQLHNTRRLSRLLDDTQDA